MVDLSIDFSRRPGAEMRFKVSSGSWKHKTKSGTAPGKLSTVLNQQEPMGSNGYYGYYMD